MVVTLMQYHTKGLWINWQLIMDNGELRRSGEVTNKNYQLRILVFCGCRYSHFSGNSSAFQAGVGSGVIVRRSVTCGYESCCLSGKGEAVNWRIWLRWISVFQDVFWLEKPNFHNRRIHSAGWISIGNLPERQNLRYSYPPLPHESFRVAKTLNQHHSL